MLRHWPVFFTILIISGCGTVPVDDTVPEPMAVSDMAQMQENEYRNTRFGYVFTVPDGLVVYALTSEQTAVVASEDSDVVFLVEGETNFFTVRGMEESRTPHEWLTQNLDFFYPTGDAAQRVGELAGSQAIFLRGDGTPTSPAQLIVSSLAGNLIVITYEQDTSTFETVVKSFSTF
jgi:hypothetical protein